LAAVGVKTAAMPRLALHRIDRYIFGQLLVALVLVTAGLVALIWLTQSLRFIQIIVNRGLSPVVFVRLTLLLVPSFAATILPITSFIVVVFIYARLAGDRELTVMRAAGMSDFALARPALALGVCVMLVCYWLNIILVPASLKSFHDYQYQIRNQIAAFLLEPGVFTQVSDDLTVYVQSRDAQNGLLGILIEDSRDRQAPATVLARSGQLQVTPQGPVVILEDGSREQVDAKTGRLDVLTFHRNVINLAQTAKSAAEDNTDPAAAPLADLFDPDVPLSDSDRAKWLVEAQRRLSAPLTAMGFILIGLLAVLGGKFRRHGGLLRPLAAVAVVTLLVAAGLAVNNFAARGLALLPLIWIVTVTPGVVAGVVLFRPRRLGAARLVARVN
jgi:lipopolysaccharide export system permease protein